MDPTHESENAARAEQLLKQAHLLRLREQWSEAEKLCREALALCPEDRTGRELLADLLAEKGDLDEALKLYRVLHTEQPEKATLEEKIARVVLRKDAEERERAAAEALLNSPARKLEQKRSATLAVLLSVLCPGAWHLYSHQYVKGSLLVFLALGGLALGGPHLVRVFLGFLGLSSGDPPSGLLAALGLGSVVVWLYGLLDAAAQVGKQRQGAG